MAKARAGVLQVIMANPNHSTISPKWFGHEMNRNKPCFGMMYPVSPGLRKSGTPKGNGDEPALAGNRGGAGFCPAPLSSASHPKICSFKRLQDLPQKTCIEGPELKSLGFDVFIN